MSTSVAATEDGWRELICEQRANPGQCQVTLAQFDYEYELLYPPIDIAAVPEFVLEPRGGTALLDAVGRLITEVGERLAALPEEQRPGRVICLIMTDGMENASRRFTRSHVADLIKAKQAAGWEFVFLSSDLSAVQEARDFNVQTDSSIRFSKRNTRESMEVAAEKVVVYHQRRERVKFSDGERKRLDDGA